MLVPEGQYGYPARLHGDPMKFSLHSPTGAARRPVSDDNRSAGDRRAVPERRQLSGNSLACKTAVKPPLTVRLDGLVELELPERRSNGSESKPLVLDFADFG